jgi:hypothetical protein
MVDMIGNLVDLAAPGVARRKAGFPSPAEDSRSKAAGGWNDLTYNMLFTSS